MPNVYQILTKNQTDENGEPKLHAFEGDLRSVNNKISELKTVYPNYDVWRKPLISSGG